MHESSPSLATARPRRSQVVRALGVLGAWLALEIVLIALAVAWVAIHSYAIDPGHDQAHYEAYAQRASPIVSLVLGTPVFGLFGFLCARRAGRDGARFALTTAILFVVIDGVIVACVPGAFAAIGEIWIVAAALKLGGAWLGGRLGARHAGARS